MKMLIGANVSLALLVLSACQPGEKQPQDGCNSSFYNTILFAPPLEEPGEYKFSMTVDGESGACEATLTGEDTEDDSCNPRSWSIYQKGEGVVKGDAIVGGPRKDILGLLVGTEAVTAVQVKVTRDGATIIDNAFDFEEVVVDDEDACEPYTKLQVTVPVPAEDK